LAADYSLQAKANMGYRVSNFTVTSYLSIIRQLQQLQEETNKLTENSAAAANNITSNTKALFELYQSYQRSAAELQSRANSLLSDFSNGVDSSVLQAKALKLVGALNKKQLDDTVLAFNTFFRACLAVQNRTVDPCDWRNPNSTCWEKLGTFLGEVGTMDPETAACAPSGIVAFFGGSPSSAFYEAFGGCGKGNLIGPFVLVAVSAAGSVLLVFVVAYYLLPNYQRWSAGRTRGTRSTTSSDSEELVRLDQELTQLEEKLRLAKLKKGRKEEEAIALVGQYRD
jgi:hypothetical protein